MEKTTIKLRCNCLCQVSVEIEVKIIYFLYARNIVRWGLPSFFVHFSCLFIDELFEWSINNDDIYQRRPHQYNKTFRCINCRELGHKARDCYQPPKQIKCHMCGVPGHQEPRCPNKLCLRVSLF